MTVIPFCTMVTFLPISLMSNVCQTPGFRGCSGARGQEAIHATRVVTIRLGCGIGFDLHLVAASQVDAGVGAGSAIELNMQLEIFKFGGADEIGAIAVLNQRAVLRLPRIFLALVTGVHPLNLTIE